MSTEFNSSTSSSPAKKQPARAVKRRDNPPVDSSSNEASIQEKKIKNAKMYLITEQYGIPAAKGIQELTQRLQLQPAEHATPLHGSEPLEPNSLKFFCSLIGDYESMLILQDKPPEPFCPSMCPETIHLFAKFKIGAAGTHLLDKHDNTVKDILGTEIVCTGHWKTPKNLEQMLSAVGAVHNARGQHGPYFDTCSKCIEELEKIQDLLGANFTLDTLWFGELG